MKFLKLAALLTGILFLGTGCSHLHKVVGSEAISETQNGIKVSVGSKEVRVGDKVDIFTKHCSRNKVRSRLAADIDAERCSYGKIGESSVLKVLDPNVAIIKPPAGFQVTSEMYVEKTDPK